MKRYLLATLALLLLPLISQAAPVRTGTPTAYTSGTANTGSVTANVPTDATAMVCGITGYTGTAGFYSGGSLTIAGNAMTLVSGGDSNTGLWMGSIAYYASASLPTGNQTLAWDWSGTGTSVENSQLLCSWYKDLDTASPVRSSNCGTQDSASPHETGTLTAQSGDLLVAFVSQFCSSECTFAGWTGATEVTEFTIFSHADGALAEASPTGNQSVSGVSGTPDGDGTVCAVTLKPTAGGGGPPPRKTIGPY